MTNVKTVIGGVESYSANTVIRAVLPSMEDREGAMAFAKEFRSKSTARLKELGIDSKEKLVAQLDADCQTVSRILADKVSEQEAAEYKEWVMLVAEKVAMASKEGGFLGFGGQQLSAAEIAAVNQIAVALGTPSPFQNT